MSFWPAVPHTILLYPAVSSRFFWNLMTTEQSENAKPYQYPKPWKNYNWENSKHWREHAEKIMCSCALDDKNRCQCQTGFSLAKFKLLCLSDSLGPVTHWDYQLESVSMFVPSLSKLQESCRNIDWLLQRKGNLSRCWQPGNERIESGTMVQSSVMWRYEMARKFWSTFSW